jgi:hypothetical protein
MKKLMTFLFALALTSIFAISAYAEDRWVFQVGTGSAYNFITPLKIEQDGEDDIEIDAEYDTKAWSTMAPYYQLRFGKWFGDHAWEFESLHHKLHLTNRPDEVDEFVISHGYNLNTINYAWQGEFWELIYRVGLGFVMTHPETEIRGERYSDEGGINGFHLSGVTSQVAVEKRFHFADRAFFYLEGKFTASYAEIPVADGRATVPNAALHGIFGIGYKLDMSRIF